MSTRIMIAHQKHGERFFDVSTPEKLAKASLKLLTDRWKEDCWYYPPEPASNRVKLRFVNEDGTLYTDSQIETLPKAMQTSAKAERNAFKMARSEYEEEMRTYKEIERVVKEKDLSLVPFRKTEKRPIAWILLNDRSDYEYERIEIVDTEECEDAA